LPIGGKRTGTVVWEEAFPGEEFLFRGGRPLEYNLGVAFRFGQEVRRRGVVETRMAKVLIIPVMPVAPRRRKGKGVSDPRYIEGQRLLAEAMKYLAQQDRESSKDAIILLSEHFRTRFRMTDRPADSPMAELE